MKPGTQEVGTQRAFKVANGSLREEKKQPSGRNVLEEGSDDGHLPFSILAISQK